MDTFKEKLKNAICKNDIGFIKRYKNQFSINERFEDEDNDTLLLYSISDYGSNMYSYFMENGADIALKNDEGENLIHSIIYSGDEKRLELIKKAYPSGMKAMINARSKDGVTPLLLAISLENFDLANKLISYGADVNIGDNDGVTPIHLAAQYSNSMFVSNLLDNGANFRIKTKIGNYPLALAVNADRDDVVKLLYSKTYKLS